MAGGLSSGPWEGAGPGEASSAAGRTGKRGDRVQVALAWISTSPPDCWQAVYLRQPQTGSLALTSLVVKKRLEGPRRDPAAHAEAGVGDRQLDEVAECVPRCRATFSSRDRDTPPSGIASRALTHRFRIASSSSPASTSTGQRRAEVRCRAVRCRRAANGSSMLAHAARCAARSIGSGSTGCARENASRCRVRSAAALDRTRMPSSTQTAAAADPVGVPASSRPLANTAAGC